MSLSNPMLALMTTAALGGCAAEASIVPRQGQATPRVEETHHDSETSKSLSEKGTRDTTDAKVTNHIDDDPFPEISFCPFCGMG